MNAQMPMNAQVECASSREEQDQSACALSVAPPSVLGRRDRSIKDHVANLSLWPWLRTNTFAPPWLPKPWRHLLVGYLVAVLLELSAVSGTHLIVHVSTLFALQGLLILLGIVVVALNWGVGPGLLAILISMAQLSVIVRFPRLALSQGEMVQGICIVVILLIGFSICVLASQSGSARQRAEELAKALRKETARSDMERRRLRTLLGVLPAPVGMVDAQGRFQELNPAHEALWGKEALPGELTQLQTHQGWWPGTGMPLAAEDWAIARALTRGETILNEEVDELVDGQRKVILHSAAPIRDETGMICGAAGVLYDMTERKRLERTLGEHVARLEAILASITDGLIVTDTQGRLLSLNPAFQALLGLHTEPKGVTLLALQQIAGYTVLDEHGHPITEAELPINRILQGEILAGTNHVDLVLRIRDGRDVYVNISGAPIRDERGHLLGAVQVLRDVTQQRRLEQHTRDTLDALLAMAEALMHVQEAPNGLGSFDSSGSQALYEDGNPRLAFVVQRLAELTRRVLECQYVSVVAVEPETAVVRPVTIAGLSSYEEARWWASWDRSYHLDELFDARTVAALRAGDPVALGPTYVSIRQWRDLFPERVSYLVPMRIGEALVGILKVDGGGEQDAQPSPNRQALIRAVARLGALVLDRERLLRHWAETLASELALREANQQMDTFVGMAGHELKTPLTSMKLCLYLVERRVQHMARRGTSGVDGADTAGDIASLLEHAAFAAHQTERLDRLVNDLLDTSRVRAGKLELHPQPADLVGIVREAVEEQRQAHPERALIVQLAADLSTVPVIADAGRIGQVVTNYLTNALKYAPADRPVVVGLDVEDHDQQARVARVWVRDEGPGLPAAEQERIWERFHRVSGIEVQSGSGIGLGLGLHICRTIIERHQGRIGIESAPGSGSTFWFTLPLASEEGSESRSAWPPDS